MLMTITATWVTIAANLLAAFQSYAIGMSLDDAKNLPIASGEYGPRQLSCSSDPQPPRFLALTHEERELGIVKCWPVETIGSGNPTRASLPIGSGISATVELHFSDGALYEVETFYDATHRQTIENGLRLKYGEPDLETVGAVQNSYGATFDQRRLVWEGATGRIVFLAPALTLERMMVTYSDPEIADAMAAQLDAAEAGALSL